MHAHSERETQSQFKICEMNRNEQLKNVHFTMTNITYCFGDIATTVISVIRSKYRHAMFFSPLNNNWWWRRRKKNVWNISIIIIECFFLEEKKIKISSITTKFIQESQVEQHLQIGGEPIDVVQWLTHTHTCSQKHTRIHAHEHTWNRKGNTQHIFYNVVVILQSCLLPNPILI